MQKLTGFLKLIRAGNLFIMALGISLFYYLIIVPVHHNILQTSLVAFNNTELILFVISVLLIAAGGYVINDYFDFELDKEYKPTRPLASGLMSLDSAMYLHMFFILSGIGLGFYLAWQNANVRIGFLYVICALLLYVYSSYLKKLPLAGNVVIALLSAFVFTLLLIFEANFLRMIDAATLFESLPYAFAVLLLQLKFYAGFAFLTTLARELVKDIEDREGDAAYKIDTFAVQFGANYARWLTIVVLLALLVALSYFMYGFFTARALKELGYVAILLALPILITIIMIIIAKQQKDYTRISLVLKLIMLLGILSIPAFYFLHQTTA